MPSRWRRLVCDILGHAPVDGGVEGILEFPVCARCGKFDRYTLDSPHPRVTWRHILTAAALGAVVALVAVLHRVAP